MVVLITSPHSSPSPAYDPVKVSVSVLIDTGACDEEEDEDSAARDMDSAIE